MDRTVPELKRRRLLKLGSLAVAAATLTSRTGSTFAQSGSRVDPGETKAQDLGYKNDAAEVDKSRFAKYEPGQMCASCQFFKGAAGDAWGPCQVFSGRQVNAKGWCVSYWQKSNAHA